MLRIKRKKATHNGEYTVHTLEHAVCIGKWTREEVRISQTKEGLTNLVKVFGLYAANNGNSLMSCKYKRNAHVYILLREWRWNGEKAGCKVTSLKVVTGV